MSSVCLKHQDRIAVGRCKLCLKPICEECKIETGEGIFCSEDCRKKSESQTDNVIQTKIQSEIDREKNPPAGPIKAIITTIIFIGVVVFGGMMLWNHIIPPEIKSKIMAGIMELLGK